MDSTTIPRGPKGRFFLGNLAEFRRDQLGFYAACAREYGDVVPVRLGPRRALLIFHPDAIEEVLVARSGDFIKSPGVRLLRPLLGDGLLLSEGHVGGKVRESLVPPVRRAPLDDDVLTL